MFRHPGRDFLTICRCRQNAVFGAEREHKTNVSIDIRFIETISRNNSETVDVFSAFDTPKEIETLCIDCVKVFFTIILGYNFHCLWIAPCPHCSCTPSLTQLLPGSNRNIQRHSLCNWIHPCLIHRFLLQLLFYYFSPLEHALKFVNPPKVEKCSSLAAVHRSQPSQSKSWVFTSVGGPTISWEFFSLSHSY